MTMQRLRDAFFRGGREQCLERKADIGALVGLHPLRDEIEAIQSENMVEPDRAGILHGGAQHFAERRAVGLRSSAAGLMPARPQRWPCVLSWSGGAPISSAGRIEVLLAPGIEAVRPDADREIEIEPDRQAGATGLVPAGRELLIGDPLDEFEVAELRRHRVARRRVKSRRVGLAPFSRPFPPWPSEAPAEHLERRKRRKQCRRVRRRNASNCRRRAPRSRVRAEDVDRRDVQRLRLDIRDTGIVDEVVASAALRWRSKFGQRGARKFGNGFDVDVERIEEKPAAWKIRACLVGPVVEQSVQRIESDRRRRRAPRRCRSDWRDR